MTKKIYEIDQYIKECSAMIKDVKAFNEESEPWVSLDQTIFYPEGGGQPADRGLIDQFPVLDVQTYDGDIYHKISGMIDKVRVKLSIDYERRFDHMQHHTGQHLLSAVWLEMYNLKTVSFHLGKDICTIDLHADHITFQQIIEVEKKVAEYIFENRTVESYVLPYNEVTDDKKLKLKDKPDFVRFVDIDGIDSSTCCGTHVSMLGEIGIIKIISWEKYKKNIRLSFVCGKRALEYFQQLNHGTQTVAQKLNVPTSKIDERFIDFYDSYQILKKKYQKLYEKEIHQEGRQLVNTAKNGVVELKWEERSLQEMKDLAKIVIESGDKVVIFCSIKDRTWIFASSSSQIFNVSIFIQKLKEVYGGKGGGNTIFGQWTGIVDEVGWKQMRNEFNIN